jgi:hypothetical protein
VYKLLAKESDITLARQPPLPGGTISSSSRGDGSGSAEGSSADSNVRDAADAADAAASGVFSAAATAPGTADGVLQGVDVYTVHLKPEPLVSTMLVLCSGRVFACAVAADVVHPVS